MSTIMKLDYKHNALGEGITHDNDSHLLIPA